MNFSIFLLFFMAAFAVLTRSNDFAVTSLACVGTDGQTQNYSFPGIMASVCVATNGSKGLSVDGKCLLASIQNTTSMPDLVTVVKNRYSCTVVGYSPFVWNVFIGNTASRVLSRSVAGSDLTVAASLKSATLTTTSSITSQYAHTNDESYMLNTGPGYQSVCCQGLCSSVCRADDSKSDCSYLFGVHYKTIACGSGVADSWCQVVGSNEVKIMRGTYSGQGLTLTLTGAASNTVTGMNFGRNLTRESEGLSLNVSMPGSSVTSMCIAKPVATGQLYVVDCGSVRACDASAALFMPKAGCSGSSGLAESQCSPIVYGDGNWNCQCASTSSTILSTQSPASETNTSTFSVPETQAQAEVWVKSVGEQVVVNRTKLATTPYGYWVAPGAILSGRAEVYTYHAPTSGWGGCTAVAVDPNGTIAANMFAFAYPSVGYVQVIAALNCGWSLVLCDDCMSGSSLPTGQCTGPMWSSNSSVCLDQSNTTTPTGLPSNNNSTTTSANNSTTTTSANTTTTTLPPPVCPNATACGITEGNVTPEGTTLTTGPSDAVVIGSSMGSAGVLGVFLLLAAGILCCCVTLCVFLMICLLVTVLFSVTVLVVLFLTTGAFILVVGVTRKKRISSKKKVVPSMIEDEDYWETMEI